MMAATTAYTAVSARRGFLRPDASSSAPSLPAASFHTPTPVQTTPQPVVKKVDWPPAVRDYVFRSFQPDNLIAEISKDDMQAKLKATLSDAAENDRLGVIDWATLPLPQQLIQQERAAMTAWNSQAYNNNAWVSIEQPDSGSKKRKHNDVDASVVTPPWERDTANGFGDRITYANKAQQSKMEKRAKKQQDAIGKGSSKFNAQAEKRKQRFGAQLGDSPPWGGRREQTPPFDLNSGPVIGTCQKLEKRYFRLNGAPKPEEVRPLDVLQKAFEHIKTKWSSEGNYVYTCDQFKSMRQDLIVQHIKNEFTVKVYELHARIALEMGDLGEYNQCQTQLRALYSLNLGGHPAEFMAYRILYFVHTCNRTALNDILSEITPELRREECVKHALAVRSAQASGNYHKLLAKLYQSVPNMGAYLMDMFVGRERIAATAAICRSYKPNVSMEFLAEELGFDTYENLMKFVTENGGEQFLTQPPSGTPEELGHWKFETAKAAPLFQQAKSKAFAHVDIKGQI